MSADSLQDNLYLSDTNISDDNISETHLSDTHIQDVSSKDKISTKKRKVTELKTFLESYSCLEYNGHLNLEKMKSLGNTLIVSASAIKCTRILAKLKFLKRRIGKLFSKHLKINDQISLLKRNKNTRCNVGTPNRILKLKEFLPKDLVVIIDMELDAKEFSILDIKDTRRDLMSFLDYLSKENRAIQVYELF